MVELDVAAELAAVEDAATVAEPGASSHSNSQRSLGGQVFQNGILLDKNAKMQIAYFYRTTIYKV